jgi:voltage-gated potassium channel
MSLKEKLRVIIFGSDTPAGKAFDIILLGVIVVSVLAVILESMPGLESRHARFFHILEWVITGIFTIEYFLRIYIAYNRRKYILGFWGLIDLASILPAYLSLFISGYHYLIIVRILRLLRIFRILKLIPFLEEIRMMGIAIRGSLRKILVFLSFVFLLVIILGSAMYVAEGGNNGFVSIPVSIYWAVVTITTVGYGDIVPQTIAGKTIATVIMLVGYAFIAVPTGIMSAEFVRMGKKSITCPACHGRVSPADKFCSHCGADIQGTNPSEGPLS